jgi:hypothetical protein
MNHIYRHFALEQSAWGAGCGFGMFSTVDYHDSRFWRCYLLTDDGQVPVHFAPHFADADLTTRVLPTTIGLTELANRLANAEWDFETRTMLCDTRSAASHVRVHGVRLELWRIQFDHTTRRLRTERIGRVTVKSQERTST